MSAFPTAASVLARFPVNDPVATGRAVAAVLAILRDGPYGVEVLLIERARNPHDPASGQIGLPGGKTEPRDPTLNATAMRECEEEVGIGPQHLKGPPRFVLVGRALSSRLRVAVFTAEVREDAPAPTGRDPAEVASVFWLREEELGTVVQAERETAGGPRLVPAVRSNGHIVWGFTLRVLRVLFGFEEGVAPGEPWPLA